jgi:hypothetical protein
MWLCSSGHEEICHESRRCPVCDIIDDYKNQIDELKNEIAALENNEAD